MRYGDPGRGARQVSGQEASGPARPVLLLVPGAWHGAWVWEKVQPALTARGWVVQTMDLPSNADRGRPRCGLYDDAAAVRQRIQGIEGPVVVVAHSYGAVPVTQGAANLPNVRHLVYVCGFMLDVGESPLGLLGTEPDWWVIDGDIMTVDNPRAVFFHDVGREDADRAIARMTPFSRVAATQALTAAAWHSVSSTYIVCDGDAEMSEAQYMFAKRATDIRHLPSSHSPMLSMPSELTNLIVEAADRAIRLGPNGLAFRRRSGPTLRPPEASPTVDPEARWPITGALVAAHQLLCNNPAPRTHSSQ